MMKQLKDIFEGIMDKNNRQTVGSNIVDTLNVPTVKDFVKNPWNKDFVGVVWDCESILNQYRDRYPKLLKNYNSIQFVLDMGYRVVTVNPWFGVKDESDPKSLIAKKGIVYGWNDSFVGSNIATYKKMVIRIISRLAESPERMNNFLKHAEQCRSYVEDKGTYEYTVLELTDI